MKIIRFLSDENHEMCGLYEPELEDQALVIRGDIFGDFEVTSKSAGIREHSSPRLSLQYPGTGSKLQAACRRNKRVLSRSTDPIP